LIVVPVLYLLLERLNRKIKSLTGFW
jgi:hypothetical protein